MNQQKIKQFNIIGISVRTSNENEQAAKDIPALWNKFMSEGIAAQIPNKIDGTIYCVYTEYEKDYTKPYTTILGCKVNSLDTIPVGMLSKTINETNYAKHTAHGNLLQCAVFNEWIKIWNTTIDRAYTADFEVYDERSLNFENAEVDIFIALK
jgi:predicted transcriptional regulator YdeE